MHQLMRIGYWRSGSGLRCPDPATFVDLSWDAHDRQKIIAYLRSGTVPWVAAGQSTCRMCGVTNGSAEFTDGTYVWPEGLAHYVDEHHVRLPEAVLEHIRRRWDELLEESIVDDEWWLRATGSS